MARGVETWPNVTSATSGNNFSGQNASTWGAVTGVDGTTNHPGFTIVSLGAGQGVNSIGPTSTDTGLKNELPGPTMDTVDHHISAIIRLTLPNSNETLTRSARIMVRYTDPANFVYAQAVRTGGGGGAGLFIRQLVRNASSGNSTLFQDTIDPGDNCTVYLNASGVTFTARWNSFEVIRGDPSGITVGNRVGIRVGPDARVAVSEVQFYNIEFGDGPGGDYSFSPQPHLDRSPRHRLRR